MSEHLERQSAYDDLIRRAGLTPTTDGQRAFFGSRIESDVRYARAVRRGDTVYVSGMTATDAEGAVLAPTLYEQAIIAFEKIGLALELLGGTLADVVKETVYFANWNDEDQWYRAHSEVFGEILPAVTGVKVGLYRPDVLLEIDAIAVVATPQQPE